MESKREYGNGSLRSTSGRHETDTRHIMDRQSRSISALVGYSAFFVAIDVFRQIIVYALRHFNNGEYPFPQTVFVFLSEVLKMLIFLARLGLRGTLFKGSVSYCYLVPATLYAVNNNIYFLALHYTTPPVWNILMQARILFTALVYRFYFKMNFKAAQWFALVLLVVAIVMTQYSGAETSLESRGTKNFSLAAMLAILASVVAAIGPVYTEVNLQNSKL